MNEDEETTLIRERTVTLFSSSSSYPRSLLQIENNQFRVLCPGFLRVFKDETHVTTVVMLCKDDTLDEEDVLMTFHVSEVHNSPCKSHSR